MCAFIYTDTWICICKHANYRCGRIRLRQILLLGTEPEGHDRFNTSCHKEMQHRENVKGVCSSENNTARIGEQARV